MKRGRWKINNNSPLYGLKYKANTHGGSISVQNVFILTRNSNLSFSNLQLKQNQTNIRILKIRKNRDKKKKYIYPKIPLREISLFLDSTTIQSLIIMIGKIPYARQGPTRPTHPYPSYRIFAAMRFFFFISHTHLLYKLSSFCIAISFSII